MLSLEELTAQWKAIAKKKAGKLTADDERIIAQSAEDAFMHMDMDGSGKVSIHEFLIYSMGAMESRGSLRSVRLDLQADFKQNPWKIQKLLDRFKAWDKNGDGYVTGDEINEYLLELQVLAKETAGDEPITRQSSNILAQKLMREFNDVDLEGDRRVDLWEVMAWALGRRKTPVELLLYDISHGACRFLGPLVGRRDLEVFHSSVLVFGSEYWYGGKVFRSSPPVSEQFGEPLRSSPVLKLEPSEITPGLMVVRMGYTLVTHDEYMAFLQEKVIDRYTGLEGYDLLTHSCNHFSDENLHFLLGRGVPDHVLEIQRMMLTPKIQRLRPFLNRYLGGFSEQAGGGDLLAEDTVARARAAPLDPNEVLGEGASVMLEVPDLDDGLVAAVVVREGGGTCDIRYFDALESRVVLKTDVPACSIKKRIDARQFLLA